MRDKLTRREDRALLRALREVVLSQFPNPERKDCPGTRVLKAIATKRISMFDAAHDHVGNCSPCFAELTQIRHALHRRKLVWALGTTGTVVLILAALLTYFRVYDVKTPVKPNTAQTELPNQPEPPVQPREVPPEVPRPTPKPPNRQLAFLDLRNVSATRTVEPSTSNIERIEIPRAVLALTIQLPIGSGTGRYEIEVRKLNQPAIVAADGQATIENGTTKLLIDIDTTSIPPGEYDFAWRLTGFSWRNHPILIR